MGGLRLFAGPSRYLQGPGALEQLGPTVAAIGPVSKVLSPDQVAARLPSRAEA